jgi:hypothetical protein
MWSLPSRFSDQDFIHISHLSHVCYMPSHPILLDLITQIIFGEPYKLWSSLLLSLLQPPATYYLLGPVLSTLFSDILSMCSSHGVRDQVSNPWKTACKIIFIYFNLYVLREEMVRQNILNRMMASISKIEFVCNLFKNAILICYCCSQIFENSQISRRFVCS